MPKASRHLYPEEIANIWAKRLYTTRRPDAVAAFKESKLEDQPAIGQKIKALIKLLPDTDLPDHVHSITTRLEVSPTHHLNAWIMGCSSLGKYGLLGSIVSSLNDTKQRLFANDQISSHLYKLENLTPGQVELAYVAAMASVNDYSDFLRKVPHPDKHPNLEKMSGVGDFIFLVKSGEALDEVSSVINTKQWSDFCSYATASHGQMESYYLKLRPDDVKWLDSSNRRMRLNDIAATSPKPLTDERPAPKASRPMM